MIGRTHSATSRRQRGLTIIELMVGMVVSLFVLAIISQVYLASRNSYRFQNASSRTQETARFAMETLGQEVRNAGYQGCGLVTFTSNVLRGVTDAAGTRPWWLDFSSSLQGYNSATTFPAELKTPSNQSPVSNSSALVILRGDSITERAVTNHNLTTSEVTVGTAHPYQTGEVLVATDCKQAAIFRATSVPANTSFKHEQGAGTYDNCYAELGASCNAAGGKVHEFKAGSLVSRLSSNGYFVAPSTTGSGNSLWVRSLSGQTNAQPAAAIELAPGVERLCAAFGVDSDGDGAANRFVAADQVGASNWSQVVSVRLEVLVSSSEDNITPQQQTYTVCGSDTTATDKRLYKVYSTTANVRNRTP
jgi:type IV pilus assembly protein PilW